MFSPVHQHHLQAAQVQPNGGSLRRRTSLAPRLHYGVHIVHKGSPSVGVVPIF